MAKYRVTIKEIHHSYRLVEADNGEQAIEVAMGMNEYKCEYIRTCDEGHEAEYIKEEAKSNE